MKCPTCGAPGKVLETRRTGDDAITLRRYCCLASLACGRWITHERLELVYSKEMTKQKQVLWGHELAARRVAKAKAAKTHKEVVQ